MLSRINHRVFDTLNARGVEVTKIKHVDVKVHVISHDDVIKKFYKLTGKK